jgi:hypothetical protein
MITASSMAYNRGDARHEVVRLRLEERDASRRRRGASRATGACARSLVDRGYVVI